MTIKLPEWTFDRETSTSVLEGEGWAVTLYHARQRGTITLHGLPQTHIYERIIPMSYSEPLARTFMLEHLQKILARQQAIVTLLLSVSQ